MAPSAIPVHLKEVFTVLGRFSDKAAVLEKSGRVVNNPAF